MEFWAEGDASAKAPGMLEKTEGATGLERRVRMGEARERMDGSGSLTSPLSPQDPQPGFLFQETAKTPVLQLLKLESVSQPSILVSSITAPAISY